MQTHDSSLSKVYLEDYVSGGHMAGRYIHIELVRLLPHDMSTGVKSSASHHELHGPGRSIVIHSLIPSDCTQPSGRTCPNIV